jgi:hypothetical protein
MVFILLVCFAMASGSSGGVPEDTIRVVIISPLLGPVIDREESQRYSIFSRYADFDSAYFFQRNDGSFSLWLRRTDKQGDTRDTVMEYSRQGMSVMAEKVNHYKGFGDGTYRMGDDPPVFGFAGTPIVLPPAAPGVVPHIDETHPGPVNSLLEKQNPPVVALPSSPDTLPHVLRRDRPQRRFYPILIAGFGIGSYGPNFDGLQACLNDIEDAYAASGHAVGRGVLDVGPSVMLWSEFAVEFSEYVRGEVCGGYGPLENETIEAGTIGVIFFPPALRSGAMRGFVSLGGAAIHANVHVPYNASIGYGTLEGVDMAFGQLGGYARGGVEWEFKGGVLVMLNAEYYFISPVKLAVPPPGGDTPHGSANLSGLGLGVRMLFHFAGGNTP